MSKERELLQKVVNHMWQGELVDEIKELLAQPEQEPKFNFDLERMKAAIESPISDVTVENLMRQVKQEPVAWILHNKETGYRVRAAYRPSALKKGWEAIPLYAGSPTCEPEQEHVGIGGGE